MVTDPVVALLARQSVARLREMQGEIREQVNSLRVQSELIERALAEKGDKPRTPAPREDGPVAPVERAAVRGKGARRRTRGKRDLFKEILETRPEHTWAVAEVQAELANRHVESSPQAIRVMLRRMIQDHELLRLKDGWKLAPANGSAQETLAGATGSESGGYGWDTSQLNPGS